MKIATKTGDKGTTGLLFGSRVSKADKHIAAVGDVDELNAALGLIKPALWKFEQGKSWGYYSFLKSIQHNLTLLMGELATEPNNLNSYAEKYSAITQEHLDELDHEVDKMEKMPELEQRGWVLYGGSDIGSRFDFASKVCRRAERTFVVLNEKNIYRPLLSKYLNRLSDFLHLCARQYDYLENLS